MSQQPAISKATFRGTIIFIIILVGIFVLPDVLMSLRPPESVHISAKSKAYRDAAEKVKRNSRKKRYGYDKGSRYHKPAAAFDPNQYTLEEWMELGLSEKQAAVVLKFGKRGIRSNEDLKKIFVISDELFAQIKDSTVYPKTAAPASWQSASAEPKPMKKIAVNTATIEELMTIKGVGAFFAKQIAKRRDELGGFYSDAQLLEVWKMDEEKLSIILPGIEIDLHNLRKININKASAEELKAHPYISWNLANSIVKLRSQNGAYKNVEGIRKSVLVTDEIYEKLKRYLTTDE